MCTVNFLLKADIKLNLYKVYLLLFSDEIIAASNNKEVIVKHLNLASFKSVREFAANILSTEPRLDILINNAGCALVGKTYTEDGNECQMQSNHFGHFLLTNLLLGKTKSVFSK